MIKYDLIRSSRKTLALYVRPDGRVEVRAPLKVSKAYIDRFVEGKDDWIQKTQRRLAKAQDEKKTILLTSEEERKYKNQALLLLQGRCAEFAGIMGVAYGNIRVNKAKTRWGSCTAKGDINFTYRLLFVPQELIDYVVVHELAHLKEMNHSPRFWAVVQSVMPDYKERRKQLKEYHRRIELAD
jgi:predicted metal-dependent hydrolase